MRRSRRCCSLPSLFTMQSSSTGISPFKARRGPAQCRWQEQNPSRSPGCGCGCCGSGRGSGSCAILRASRDSRRKREPERDGEQIVLLVVPMECVPRAATCITGAFRSLQEARHLDPRCVAGIRVYIYASETTGFSGLSFVPPPFRPGGYVRMERLDGRDRLWNERI